MAAANIAQTKSSNQHIPATKRNFKSVAKIEIVKTEVNLSEDLIWLGCPVTDEFSLSNWTEGIPELDEKVNAQSSLPSLDFTGFSEIDSKRLPCPR